MEKNKIKVLVVDDSSFIRKALKRIFDADPEIDMVGTAVSGSEAIEKVLSLCPDVVTLDISMPGMDGLETLKVLMDRCPTPVLMLSQFTKQGADLTLKSLELGAMDFVDKSTTGAMDFLGLAREITSKIKSIAGSKPMRIRDQSGALPAGNTRGIIDVVSIGASTGGPLALQMLLPKFPKDITFSVVVVQHMPVGFTAPLSSRLNSISEIKVREAEEGDFILPGTALVAPAGVHMEVNKKGDQLLISLSDVPLDKVHKPSVDVLFSSVARAVGKRAMGVLLTGMGSDGAKGLGEIQEKGGITLAQDEATSSIFGMPRVAIERGFADKVFPIHSMAEEIMKRA